MQFTAPEDRLRTLVFTSSVPREGKSFCAINHSVALAQQGYRTLLIDADLRLPSVGKAFLGGELVAGLSDVLRNHCAVETAISLTSVENLSILSRGNPRARLLLAYDAGVLRTGGTNPARASGIPLVTWYAHPSLTLPIRLAHVFSNRVVTSLPSAYPYRTDKLSVIGQGIDTALFAPSSHREVDEDMILCVGRISRVKDHPTLLRAVALLRRDVRLVILGATAGAKDEAYARELQRLVAELRLEEAVTFAPSVSSTELPARYRECAVHVNLTPARFGDKVAWEAMSCARPCLVANEDFRETLGKHSAALSFRTGDAADLAQKLTALLEQTEQHRAAVGADLRANVERLHSLPRLADRILAELSPAPPVRAVHEHPLSGEVACAR